MLGNTQRGMVLLAAGVDKPVELESKFILWGCLFCIAFAVIMTGSTLINYVPKLIGSFVG